MKYFYTCAIKAAYMAKEFGVKYEEEDSTKRMIAHNFEGVKATDWKHPDSYLNMKGNWIEKKFYVAPESEKIFEPKLFDLGHHLDDAPVIYQKEVNSGEMAWLGSGHHYGLYKDSEVEIIKREGKLFFMPESESSN